MSPAPLSVLARIRATWPQPSPYERCELCGSPVAAEHGHVVSLTDRALRCTCRPCWLLFTAESAALAYRAVPDRFLAFPPLPAPLWETLELPVGTAFLFVNSTLGRWSRSTRARPAPPSRSCRSRPGTPCRRRPGPGRPAPGVEALLVHTRGGPVEACLVPIDICYELVGSLRTLWRGFDGGGEVRSCLDGFFAGLRARSTPAGGTP